MLLNTGFYSAKAKKTIVNAVKLVFYELSSECRYTDCAVRKLDEMLTKRFKDVFSVSISNMICKLFEDNVRADDALGSANKIVLASGTIDLIGIATDFKLSDDNELLIEVGQLGHCFERQAFLSSLSNVVVRLGEKLDEASAKDCEIVSCILSEGAAKAIERHGLSVVNEMIGRKLDPIAAETVKLKEEMIKNVHLEWAAKANEITYHLQKERTALNAKFDSLFKALDESYGRKLKSLRDSISSIRDDDFEFTEFN